MDDSLLTRNTFSPLKSAYADSEVSSITIATEPPGIPKNDDRRKKGRRRHRHRADGTSSDPDTPAAPGGIVHAGPSPLQPSTVSEPFTNKVFNTVPDNTSALLLRSRSDVAALVKDEVSAATAKPPTLKDTFFSKEIPSALLEIQYQSLSDYLSAELHPGPSYCMPGAVWGQTERERVYNAIIAVPFQLERFIWFGVAICSDSFLGLLTWLPLRVGVAVVSLSSSRKLRGDQMYDMIGLVMFIAVLFFLWSLDVGAIYFWLKDMTQEFLKLSVLYTALDLSDKICCSFGKDSLEALAASCTTLADASMYTMKNVCNVISDTVVCTLLILAHGIVLMTQAMVFGVAMNSKKNTLIALLIAANFGEIKGSVLKRFDATRLYTLACQDVVERFHLIAVLLFVVVEEMVNSGQNVPNPRLLRQCVYVFFSEMCIDVIKHAVLGKFNEVRPGMYREYMKDLSEKVSAAQSHSIHKLVGLEPFAPTALFVRVVVTYCAISGCGKGFLSMITTGVALWGALILIKIALGYSLHCVAMAYIAYYAAMHGVGARRIAGASGKKDS